MTVTRIGLIGAGNIAETHAAALKAIANVTLTAVVDPQAARAASFARRWGIANSFGDTEALIAAKLVDAVHILVPPPLHKSVAEPFLKAGIHVFLEKPMAESAEECAELSATALAGNAKLRVNHNFVYHPAQLKAQRLIAANRVGPVRHVDMHFNLPLRQLGGRQLGHWMFDGPKNLLLEQAVHPLSQLDDLVGAVEEVTALPAPPLQLAEGQSVYRRWLVSLKCARGTAQLYLSLGETYPAWGATIIGDDGMISVDYLNNSVSLESGIRWPDFADSLANGWRVGLANQGAAIANAAGYVASVLKLRPRSDVFFQSMQGSIKAFHADLAAGRGDLTGADGRRMVSVCEKIAAHAKPADRVAAPAISTEPAAYDVLVIGGTGFIGAHLVARLIASGRQVGVLARNLGNLPALFRDPRVHLIRGDARKPGDVDAAIAKAKFVINLAHGGGGASRAEVEASLVGAAETVAEACMKHNVQRLVFVSSIASLYLGDPAATISATTPTDPEPETRADYARAKVLAENKLIELHRTRGLPVVILRPGVVIGEGGLAFHSGIGFYNRDRHCMGWNNGTNPLPLVLVEDVADATAKALDAAGIDGKSYNLVGDIRLNARDYIAELAKATGRPLVYHGQPVELLYAVESMKAVVKRVTGRKDMWPSLRDLKSRGLPAQFDCSDAVRELDWHPVADRAQFLQRGFEVHAGES
jgi:predicted dehydrogenase/nucleoside-diphosphate-sugar epimerase